jgi:hypothetical protein
MHCRSDDPCNREPEKCDDLGWFPVDALPTRRLPFVQRALVNYRRGVWCDSDGFD